jgi:Ca-activated chloride channel family protein
MVRSNLRRALSLVLSVASIAGTEQVFRSSTEIVPVFVTVTDASGRLVEDLTREHFEVLDNGVPQPITLFDSTRQPVELIALLDVSGSMAENLPLLRRACVALVEQLAPDDRARVGTFGAGIAIGPNVVRSASDISGLLPATIAANAPTPLWRAVSQSIGEFPETARRRVVLVLSDGRDTDVEAGALRVSSTYVADRARRADVMIYGVGLRSAPGAVAPGGVRSLSSVLAPTVPDPALRGIAGDTGGGYFDLSPHDDLAGAFSRVVQELHRQYLLGFAPPARDGAVHAIEVRMRTPGLRTQSRKSYVAPRKD